jgi:hypothetical protein
VIVVGDEADPLSGDVLMKSYQSAASVSTINPRSIAGEL